MVVNGLNTYTRAGGPLYLAWMARKAEITAGNVRAESINLPSLFWKTRPPGLKNYNPSRQFSHLFNTYAKAINKRYRRTGSLFQKPFGRVEIETEAHLLRLVTDIHQNPQKHGFADDFRLWPYTSYQIFLSPDLTNIKREEVLGWFNGERGFRDSHQYLLNPEEMGSLGFES
jgi:hypothetical protein